MAARATVFAPRTASHLPRCPFALEVRSPPVSPPPRPFPSHRRRTVGRGVRVGSRSWLPERAAGPDRSQCKGLSTVPLDGAVRTARTRSPFFPVIRHRPTRYHARMVLNAGCWARYLRNAFIPTIDAFRSTLAQRLLDSFSGIENDAETFADEEYARLGGTPSDGSVDLGDIAEKALGNAIIYYQTLYGLRQGFLNLLAAGLYHLFEQQQQAFISGQAPHQRSTRFCAFLRDHGVDCATFSCADKIRELRLVANVAKHGAGCSARTLATLRSDLFEPREVEISPSTGRRSNLQHAITAATTSMSPISGDDLYVSAYDLAVWCDSVKTFWAEFAENLERQQRESE